MRLDFFTFQEYILGGVSFGFTVANHCQIDQSCKGFLALEPFINRHYISDHVKYKKLMEISLDYLISMGMYERIYHSQYFKKFMLSGSPNMRFDTIRNTVDAYTFFQTAKLLLHHDTPPTFHERPYVLVINEQDKTVCGPKIIKLFQGLERALIIKTTAEHYPRDLSKAYFKQHIKLADIEKIVQFSQGDLQSFA